MHRRNLPARHRIGRYESFARLFSLDPWRVPVTQANVQDRRRVGSQLVGSDHGLHNPALVEKQAPQMPRPPSLDRGGVEKRTVVFNGAPGIRPLATDDDGMKIGCRAPGWCETGDNIC